MIKIDVHIHTNFSSDSVFSPHMMLKFAQRFGINLLAITDHNTIQGAINARKYAPDGMTVILGSEVMTEYGEVIGLFLEEEINTHHFYDVVDSIHDQGGISVFAHPYRKFKALDNRLLKSCDVIEIWNGRTKTEKNKVAMDMANLLKKPGVVGSDSHFPFELGNVYNLVDIHDMSDIEEECRKKTG